MNRLARSTARWAILSLAVSWLAGVACGGNVVVDTGSTSSTSSTSSMSGAGGGGGGVMTSASAGGSAATGSGSGIQFPDGGTAACVDDYKLIVDALEVALGCTPSATTIVQCDGTALVRDPCGCLHVGNEAIPENIAASNADWQDCVTDGCCGTSANPGCSPCAAAPTAGYCDPATSQCAAGQP